MDTPPTSNLPPIATAVPAPSEAALREKGGASELSAHCHAMINAAGSTLLERGTTAGAVRHEVPLGDLLKMAKAFALAAETSPEGPALAERLLVLSMDGLRPR